MMTVIMLASFCLIPSMAISEESIVFTAQPESVTVAKAVGTSKDAAGKADGKGDFQAAATKGAPVITSQPEDAVVNEGEEATFKIVANGAAAYQWYFRPAPKAEWVAVKVDGTSAAYTFTAEAKHNGYEFRCVVTNKMGKTVSDEAALTVVPKATATAPTVDVIDEDEDDIPAEASDSKPVILSQPDDIKVVEGEKAVFEVMANGDASYQWYFRRSPKENWTAVNNGGTSSSFSLNAETKYDGYQFRCIVSNKYGETISDEVTLIVLSHNTPADTEDQIPSGFTNITPEFALKNGLPIISTQPSDQTVSAGQKATFKVVASSVTKYQWYYRKPNESTWTAVSNDGTSATYSLTTAARHDGYNYRCLVSNSAGSVWSSIAKLTVKSTPVITTQPANVTVNVGQKATFKVVASGAKTYKWYYKKTGETTWNEVLNNGTSASYTLTTGARHNGYQYCCLVSNNSGSVWSETAKLTVTTSAKPTITTQPVSKKVNEGAKVTFKVVATGATKYQWYYQKNGETTWNAVSNNGTSASYTLTTAARHNGYKYRVKVSNSVGSVYSNTVTLTLNLKPAITTQPTNKKVNEGAKATFKVVATNAKTYQWYYRKPGETTWNAVSNNGTSATYTLTTAARHNGYKYRVKVSNSVGSVYSNTVTLTVTSSAKPTITTQPTNKTVNEGTKVTFKVVATGATSYQWYYQKPGETAWNAVQENGTSASYTLTTAARHNGYKYRVKVSNSVGSVYSNTVTLTLNLKPAITTQPTNKKVNEGAKATFKVVATNAKTYQWYYRKPGETTWNAVSNNGTSATYTLTTAARHNGYKYRVKVSNSVGYVYSNIVTLTVVSTGAYCGDNLTWTLDSNGVLTISGTGAMWSYSKILENNPGLSWRTSVTQVKISEGVTSIGESAFESCTKLTKATLPSTLKKIGAKAFKNCSALTTITSP